METKKTFWKDKKNIAIIILSFLLFCAICAYSTPTDITEYENKINELNSQVNTLNEIIQDNNNQIQNLQDANKLLQEDKNKLENEKNELNSQIEELQKTSSTQTTSSTNNSQMVWVGETGTKYHNQGCRTLKGKGHQITMQQALAEGREPCKVCH